MASAASELRGITAAACRSHTVRTSCGGATKADWYDPTKDITDPILGKKDHSSEKVPEKIGSRWW